MFFDHNRYLMIVFNELFNDGFLKIMVYSRSFSYRILGPVRGDSDSLSLEESHGYHGPKSVVEEGFTD